MLIGVKHNLDSCDWSELDREVTAAEVEKARVLTREKQKMRERKRAYRKARDKDCSECGAGLTETTCEWAKWFGHIKLFCPACYKEYLRGWM